jgi:hypothetical protein
MSSADLFAPEERLLLKELPFKVILAAVVADVRGPAGTARKESTSAAHALVSEALATYAENEIIQGVLQDVANDPADEEEIALKDDAARHAAIVEALRIGSEGAALLARIDDQEQAAQYKTWVVDAAMAAVEATRSSILNFTRVSDDEDDFLYQLRVALVIIAEDPERSQVSEETSE